MFIIVMIDDNGSVESPVGRGIDGALCIEFEAIGASSGPFL